MQVTNVARARVTQPAIPDDGQALDPATRDDRPWALARRPAAAPARMPAAASPDDSPALRATAAPRRLAPRRAALRLIPLGAFAWGTEQTPSRPRTRPEHLLLHVTQGAMRLDFPRDHLMLAPGQICFIPAGTAFAARPRSDAEGQALLISPDLCGDMDPGFPDRRLSGTPDHGADALAISLQDMADEARGRPDAQVLTCHLNLLAVRLFRLDPIHAPHRAQQIPAAPDRPLVDRFLSLAVEDLGACRTLADLAEDLGATLTQLDRACQEARGRRAIDLVNELRLERAAEMLRHTDRAPTWIARDLGFASQTHMTRAFVTATGRTPEAYRAQMR